MSYDFKVIEQKWQNFWEKNKIFKAEDFSSKPKYYILDMFPYPSSAGLHVGHPEGYTATDIIARYYRMKGYNVLHPMGWDAFGLPAENYAIKTGTHPEITTKNNIDIFRKQIKRLGFSYDWDREFSTTDPSYYKWTQWIFLQLYKKGLAYRAFVPINWCPSCKVGLANEEVIGGRCERCGNEVIKKDLLQWMLKITLYADRLLEDLKELEWPEGVIEMQKNWIGKSVGANVLFKVKTPNNLEENIEVFTTRPDTLFGATYIVLAPEHPLVEKLTLPEKENEVKQYIEYAKKTSEIERTSLVREKTGVHIGSYAVNPVNNKLIPIWISDYVIMGYGTGAIMAVPCHDTRDFEFAKKFNLPIIEVISSPNSKKDENGNLIEAYTEEGIMVNSGEFNDLPSEKGKEEIVKWLEKRGLGKSSIQYRLRDWVFARQRYWGEPIPVVHCEKCGEVLLPEEELPLLLPKIDKYEPTQTGESPLANIPEFVNTTCPKCKGKAKRETNTMPQWAGSCWYYLRFIDPKNKEEAWNKEKEKYWMPVDLYIGGAEHAVLHLLYARFWHKVLYDLGLVSTKEPFKKLVNQGLILGYSYRYFDDNINNNPDAKYNVYSYKMVIEKDKKFYHKDSKIELMPRYIFIKNVVWKNEKPYHPEFEDLELEEVVEKMSKSLGNVINPDEIIDQYGADAMRLYEMFMGPLEVVKPWSTKGVDGVFRFLQRAWRLFIDENNNLSPSIKDETPSEEELRLLHKTIKKVTEDIEKIRFNTAISQLMIFVNEMTKKSIKNKTLLEKFILLLSPFAPHICEELWEKLGHNNSLAYEPWPIYDEELAKEKEIEIAIQVNGKLRSTIKVSLNSSNELLEEMALKDYKIQKYLDGKKPKKVIVVPNKLVNIVI